MPAEDGGPGSRPYATGAGRSILVVDDDPLVRQLLVRMLESSGYVGHTAADAAEARQRLNEQDFAAILIDVRMPGESGIDLLKHVATKGLGTAPVMVTASDDPGLVETAFRTGAYGYVVKPFRMSELLINITNALHRRELEMRNRDYIRELEEKVARHRTLNRTIAPLDDPATAPITTEEVIGRLSGALSARDEETGNHIRRMSYLSAFLAEQADIGTATPKDMRLASALHDVGKIGVPDAVLLKPGPLNAEEQEVMQRHTVIGHRMLSDSASPLLQLGASIALTHHERWDGNGYPNGLAGEDIPPEGRVTALADVYDALTSDRVYRLALDPDDAIAHMRSGRGRHFDPDLLDLFIDTIDQVRPPEPDPAS
ncbi:MAG TPA: HD domain-containing phosphohydrolase [Actinomycetota bacterium]|nr:HD domain-containing phosphohydrolase [Actinomycetota bacterium]